MMHDRLIFLCVLVVKKCMGFGLPPLPPQKALPHLRFLLNLPLLLHCSLNHNAQSAKLAKREHKDDDITCLELIANGQ
jgi:hypothetical protein